MSNKTPWLTAAEAAISAAVSVDTIYRACTVQALRHVRINGRRSIRIRPAWLDAWLEQHTASSTLEGPAPTPTCGFTIYGARRRAGWRNWACRWT